MGPETYTFCDLSNKHWSGKAYFLSSVHLFIVAKNKSVQCYERWQYISHHEKEIITHGLEMHAFCNLYTCSQETFNLTSIHDRGAQRDVRPQQCILLCPCPCTDCAHAVFVSSMFTLSVTEVDSQPNVVSHYGQAYITQKVCIYGPMIIKFFMCI